MDQIIIYFGGGGAHLMDVNRRRGANLCLGGGGGGVGVYLSPRICPPPPPVLSRFPRASYLWSTGATSSSITVSAPGPYWVTVSSCGAADSDTIQVSNLINPIIVDLGNDTSLTCTQSLTLSAGFPGSSYLWSTGATSSSITVSAPGPYWVTVSSCGATDSDRSR
ncbi:MAG: hypothetical protein IPH32_15450 [Bacteroidetes bacterium]|nr:hypothetical protein [Bacteroidota bacterium]